MKTYIIFYSRKEIPDEQVSVLKNHLSDCLVFCNLDRTNIKESHFWDNHGNNKIIICGSQNTLKSWAKQWTQAYSSGYDDKAKGLIFFISQENLKALANGNISMNNAQEDICIDGFIFDKCKYLCGGVEFHSGKKAILNKIKHNVGSVTRPSKTVVRQSHGSVMIMQKNGESKQYIIPTPDLSSTTKYFFGFIGIGIRDEGDATIQVVPDCISPYNIRTEFRTMYPKGFIAFHINGTWLFGDVSEIVAANETENSTKKTQSSKE